MPIGGRHAYDKLGPSWVAIDFTAGNLQDKISERPRTARHIFHSEDARVRRALINDSVKHVDAVQRVPLLNAQKFGVKTSRFGDRINIIKIAPSLITASTKQGKLAAQSRKRFTHKNGTTKLVSQGGTQRFDLVSCNPVHIANCLIAALTSKYTQISKAANAGCATQVHQCVPQTIGAEDVTVRIESTSEPTGRRTSPTYDGKQMQLHTGSA